MKKKIVALSIISITIITVIAIGITYALYIKKIETEKVSEISTGCFDINLTEEKNQIKLENAYPLTDEEGGKTVPFSFTITNTCSILASYKIYLEMYEETTLESDYVAVKVNSESKNILGELNTLNPLPSGIKEGREIKEGTIGEGDSKEVYVRIWVDESVTLEDDAQDKVYKARIGVVAVPSTFNPVENGITKLNEAILAMEYQTTDINLAKTKIQSKGEVDTTKTAPIIDWQEKVLEETTITYTKPSCTEIGKLGVTENKCKFLLGTGKVFEQNTGYFSLANTSHLDPTTLDFVNNDYYFVSGIGFDWMLNGNVNVYETSRHLKAYKIKDVTVKDGTSTSKENTINTKIYTFKVIPYTAYEVESDKSDKGLYAVSDDYGTSYVYRGSVKNNYVKFAGAYFRILRINGDNTIRMIYSGTTSDADGVDLGINKTKYKFNNAVTNPAYVGYMYGKELNTSYEKTNANEVDSNAKVIIDSWYKTNIEDKGYTKYIADSGFCNDRSIIDGNGYATNVTTTYGGNKRYYKDKRASLICPNKENDLFTTNSASNGNKALKYPVGLITADELMLSGLTDGFINKMSWTYTNDSYYSMTPAVFGYPNLVSSEFFLVSDGYVRYNWVTDARPLRPVINLKSDTEIVSGRGTQKDPFIIKTN